MASIIKTHSSHLFGLLTRASVPSSPLENAFALSIERGGLLELDFEREEGVSYNPRPARHCHILLSDYGSRDLQTLEACLLASIWELNPLDFSAAELTYLHSRFPDSAPLLEEVYQEQPASKSARVIKLAQLLDRARHVHLSKDAKKLEKVKQEVRFYLELSEQEHSWKISERIFLLLHSWLNRIERRA